MADIFGYEQNTKNNQIVSSDFSLITIGGGTQSLMQDFRANYGQKIEEVKSLGDPQIYWLTGSPAGSIEASKLVGTGQFFEGWVGDCGRINNAQLNQVGAGKCGVQGTGSLSFTGAVTESVGVSLQSQQQTMTQNVKIRISGMAGT